MSSKLQENITYLGLSFGKELFVFITMNVLLGGVLFALIYSKVPNMISIILGAFIPLLDYLYISRYGDMVKKKKEERNNEFVSLLSYFEIFITNRNNVYKSFEAIIPYASPWMKDKINVLLKEIDNDKSVAPFINFSKNFSYLVIQNVMIAIFQMIEQGESKASLMQFDYLFLSLSDALYHELIERKNKAVDSLNAFPLFGAGIITIILTLSIMSILGDIVNVI